LFSVVFIKFSFFNTAKQVYTTIFLPNKNSAFWFDLLLIPHYNRFLFIDNCSLKIRILFMEPDISGTEFITGGALDVLVRRPEGGTGKAPVALMLHGWGAKESDIYELVPFIDCRVMIVAPRAPAVAMQSERGAFMWYDRGQPGQVLPGIFDDSTARLHTLVGELSDLTGVNVDNTKIFIGGFSQGGVMSFRMATLYPEFFAGIMPHSGFVSKNDAPKLREGAYRGKPVFLAHGVHDMVIQVNRAHEAREILQTGGADLTYSEYPIGHETSLASRQALADWLNNRL
jgi:phospholipase/carboxylesterase